MTGLAADSAMVSIAADDEDSMPRPTDRSRTFAQQRASRGGKFIAEAVPAGEGFLGRFAAPGYDATFVEDDQDQRVVYLSSEEAELAAARVLLTLLTKRSNQLAFEKNDRYRKMTPGELADGLADAGVTAELFAHIMGTDPNRVRGWLEGTQDIPHSARIVLELLKAAESNVDVAEKTADAVATARRES